MRTPDALAVIDRHGLYIIQDGDRFAVSIDETGDRPTEEQRRFCQWFDTAEIAAEAYITDNADLF